MKTESGRSLIEVVGAMAIAGVLMAGVIATYNTIRARAVRKMAVVELSNIHRDVKLLMSAGGNYTGVSVDYLIMAGALKNAKQPIGGADWGISANADGSEFQINLTGLSNGECAYFTTININFATRLNVNGSESEINCLYRDNKISFISK